MDFFPGAPMEQRLLRTLYDLGIAGEIAAAETVDNALAQEYQTRLEKDYGVGRENAARAVAAWCVCYGRDTLGKPCAVTLSEPKKESPPPPQSDLRRKGKPDPRPVSPFDLLPPQRKPKAPPKRRVPPVVSRPAPGKPPAPPAGGGGTYNDRFSFSPAENGLGVTGFSGETETLTIPDRRNDRPVTEIAPGAFAGSSVAQVVAVGPLAVIGEGAFRGCPRLGQIILSPTLAEIGNGAFEDCTALTGLAFPPGLRRIGGRAFAGTAMGRAALPASLTELGKGAFRDCKALEEVFLPPSLRLIPPTAFEGCGALRKIVLPPGLAAVGGRAFAGCPGLEAVDIPATVEDIAPDAFDGCRPDLWIFCRKGSAAEGYARQQRIPFQITE